MSDAVSRLYIRGSDEARFFARVVQDGDCWRWTGSFSSTGYGSFSVPTAGKRSHRTVNAHRWAYIYMVSDHIIGLSLDHLCRNRWCVNPWHLDPVPDHVNIARGNAGVVRRLLTQCPQGHPYSGTNLGIGKRGDGREFRYCRQCSKARGRRVRSVV